MRVEVCDFKSRGCGLSILSSDEIILLRTQLPQTNYTYQPMDRIKDVRALARYLSLDVDLTHWFLRD